MTDGREAPIDRDDDSADDTVLELFGVKLSVNNPRLAEILTMDAKEALTTDVKDLVDPAAAREKRAELLEAVPDIMVTPPTPHDEYESEQRAVFRERVDGIGTTFGFDVARDGVWHSPTGLVGVVRPIDKDVTFAVASDTVRKLDVLRASHGGSEGFGLIVTHDQRTSDIFRVAIRQAGAYGHVRTSSADVLSRLAGLMSTDEMDHTSVLALLAPIAAVDIAEVVALMCLRDSAEEPEAQS